MSDDGSGIEQVEVTMLVDKQHILEMHHCWECVFPEPHGRMGSQIVDYLSHVLFADLLVSRLSKPAHELLVRITEVLDRSSWQTWCWFNLDEWTTYINHDQTVMVEFYNGIEDEQNTRAQVSRPQYRQALDELVQSGIIEYIPEPGSSNDGRIVFNLDYGRWAIFSPEYGHTKQTARPFIPATIQHLSAEDTKQIIERLIANGRLSERFRGRMPMREWVALRNLIFERDDNTCQYCGKRGGVLHCDHVIPLSRGGTNDPDNLATACDVCNLSKHARTVEEWLS
jgi:hypothetical protein